MGATVADLEEVVWILKFVVISFFMFVKSDSVETEYFFILATTMKTTFRIMYLSLLMTAIVNAGQAQEKITPVFNHLAIYVKDLAKMTEFYKDIVLLEPIEEPFKVGRHSWFSLGSGMSLHLIGHADDTQEHHRNNHLCISVPSIDDYIAHLDKTKTPYYNSAGELGGRQKRPDGVQQIYIVDPEGHWIEINDEVGMMK